MQKLCSILETFAQFLDSCGEVILREKGINVDKARQQQEKR